MPIQVKDAIEGNYVFQTERFRLDYLQDLKKEANQRAQVQAAIVSLLMPTLLLLYDHLSKRDRLDQFTLVALIASIVSMSLSLALSLLVLVPVPTGAGSKFEADLIPQTSITEALPDGGFSLDVECIRKEARVIAILLLRRDRMLRLGAVALGGSIILSSLALVRFLL